MSLGEGDVLRGRRGSPVASHLREASGLGAEYFYREDQRSLLAAALA